VEYSNILIIKMSSVGDIIHALPFAAALRERYPKAKISWLVHPQFAGFLPEKPYIDEIIYFDKVAFMRMSWQQRLTFIREFRQELRAKQFDLVIDLQGLFKSAALAYLTGCPEKIGYCEMREGSGLVSRAIKGEHFHGHVIERYLDVARYLGADVRTIAFPLPDLHKEQQTMHKLLVAEGMEEVRRRKTLDGRLILGIQATEPAFPVFNLHEPLDLAPYVVLVPGARWETKRWPMEYFAKLAKMFLADGFYVVLAGGKEDVRRGEIIRELANFPKNLISVIGKTSLRELAALIKDCYFYVSADTGPLHIASAYKKPLIALYGPTLSDRTGPYGDKEASVLVSTSECRGCLKKQCNDWQCMYKLTPEMVYKTFKQKMEAGHA